MMVCEHMVYLMLISHRLALDPECNRSALLFRNMSSKAIGTSMSDLTSTW